MMVKSWIRFGRTLRFPWARPQPPQKQRTLLPGSLDTCCSRLLKKLIMVLKYVDLPSHLRIYFAFRGRVSSLLGLASCGGSRRSLTSRRSLRIFEMLSQGDKTIFL